MQLFYCKEGDIKKNSEYGNKKTADINLRRGWKFDHKENGGIKNGGLGETADLEKRRVECDTKETAGSKNGGHKETAGWLWHKGNGGIKKRRTQGKGGLNVWHKDNSGI